MVNYMALTRALTLAKEVCSRKTWLLKPFKKKNLLSFC